MTGLFEHCLSIPYYSNSADTVPVHIQIILSKTTAMDSSLVTLTPFNTSSKVLLPQPQLDHPSTVSHGFKGILNPPGTSTAYCVVYGVRDNSY